MDFFGWQVLSSDNPKHGYNAATGKYEDLMAAGIIDPTKVSKFPYFLADWNPLFRLLTMYFF